jgi:alkyl sulfatase BDS1-like metallo-beta-lactamase superfamily hydrolase
MAKYSTADHHLQRAVEWVPENPAESINDHIFMSRGTSNSYLVTTGEGDVVINTGMPYQGARHRERYEELLGRSLVVRKMLFTQSHPDHMGGWAAFNDPGVELVVQRNFFDILAERKRLTPFFAPRGARILTGLMPRPEHVQAWHHVEDFETAAHFSQRHSFTVGEREFVQYATPSGETLDSMIVWLPQEKVLFTGNLFGALYGALPHFYTLRGDRQRSITQCLRDLDLVLGLEPDVLITGHDDPIVGAARIAQDLGRIRECVQYILDKTIEGMNENKDVFTLMGEIELPAELQPAPGRGPVSWYVRSVWEELTGWFRQESTTELYAVPQRAIWAELSAMAGGPDALAERARAHAEAGRPLEALHFTDMIFSLDPAHRAAREAELAALEQLLERSGGSHYDELGWLESEIRRAKEHLNG